MTSDADLHARARARARLGDGLMQARLQRLGSLCQWCPSVKDAVRHIRIIPSGKAVQWEVCPDCTGVRWSSRRDEARELRSRIAKMPVITPSVRRRRGLDRSHDEA